MIGMSHSQSKNAEIVTHSLRIQSVIRWHEIFCRMMQRYFISSAIFPSHLLITSLKGLRKSRQRIYDWGAAVKEFDYKILLFYCGLHLQGMESENPIINFKNERLKKFQNIQT